MWGCLSYKVELAKRRIIPIKDQSAIFALKLKRTLIMLSWVAPFPTCAGIALLILVNILFNLF